ncbi:hypothetical protein IQ37_18115 [Chryseobacterium piperi]|uniref:Uncharacterized protein n=1 Tax=Chryseobacterium piperi TaxID=558152 RepID=A0A086AH08_9FLAO|nr:hypothetical protein [Chryseobacterium piperi]ASW74119.1 hypothetical protein CJF12_07320 [Chryseobacterium piperi]KFF15972.1 hypothetical protein IQ37_18115 [Chryseobacterium piperi]
MKNNPALKGLAIAIVAFIIAFGIYFFFLAKKNYYLVDNPTPNTYYYKINNGSEGIISAGQSVQVNLNQGKNAIKVFDRNKKLLYDSAFQVNKIRGLVNIAHQDYYINRQYYGYNLKKDSLLLELNKTVIDGKEYFGGAKHFNKLFTDDFYYNVDEDYDKVIKNIDKVESRSKIFRKQDYLNYYKEYYKF